MHFPAGPELNLASGWRALLLAEPPPFWIGALVSAAMIVLMAVVRIGWTGYFPLPIGYGVPIVLIAMLRRRSLLWGTVAGFAVLTIVKFFIILPEKPSVVHLPQRTFDWIEGGLVLIDLLLVAGVVDVWIVTRNWLDSQRHNLEQTNTDLAAREEEIARQNEELQSQTEELERQSEELRVTNDELASREKTLEILLSLSRSLSTELSADEIMTRICQTLGLLINGPQTAAAILEQHGNRVVVRCHHGFGPQGIREESIPLERSFASLILTKGRTGYIEDINLRPDLTIPQPKSGAPMVAILATPLRVRGTPIGSLEVYHRDKTAWNQEQISLVESLAAQTSVSLEAARLFETVAEERNRFEAVLRVAPVGIAVCDANCTWIRLNPAGAAILGVAQDQKFSGSGEMPWHGFRDGNPLKTEDYPIVRAARSGQEVDGEEIELLVSPSRRIVILSYARPIRDAGGAAQGAVSVFVNITTHKELQRELDVRRREAEEASLRKTRFLAAVSHDIRTPANAISLLAELIRRTATNPALAADVPDLARELYDSSVSLVTLLSDVLDIARFDSDRVELVESEFPLAALLADEVRQMLPLARDKQLLLELDPSDEPIVLRTDRLKLARVMGNLIGNAIKFTDSGGVRIGAARNPDNTVQITVVDTGVGIAPEHLHHIFDEFFQLRNPERDRNKGSGLGLTICRRLADAMGATLTVRSALGQGSTFTVTLPAFSFVPQKPTTTSG